MNKGVANNAAAAGQGGFSSLITTFSFALTRLVPLLHCTYTQCLKFFKKKSHYPLFAFHLLQMFLFFDHCNFTISFLLKEI